MLVLAKLPTEAVEDVIASVADKLWEDLTQEEQQKVLDRVNNMTPEEFFKEYVAWNLHKTWANSLWNLAKAVLDPDSSKPLS